VVLQVLVSSWRHFFRYSYEVLVYSRRLLDWRKASTVAKALSIQMGIVEPGSGLGEGLVTDLGRR
jgi:hypothetical protein